MAATLWQPAASGMAYNGAPANSGRVYGYAPGTSTLKAMYPTKADAEANSNALANPVVLDSQGRAQIWLDGVYDIEMETAGGVSLGGTYQSVGDATGENALPGGYMSGLEVSVNATDSDHDIDISAGEARDVADTADIVLATAITKRLDATFEAGTANGGMESGTTLSANTDYYVYGIVGVGSGLSDVVVSASSSAPTMPSGYDARRVLAKVRTDNAANIASVLSLGGRLDSAGWEFVEEISGGGATYDFRDGITPDCDAYAVVVTDLRPQTDGSDLWLRLHDAVLDAWQEDALDYEFAGVAWGSDSDTAIPTRSAGDTKIRLNGNTGDASTEGVCGTIRLFNLATAGSMARARAQMNWATSSTVHRMSDVHGVYKGAQNRIDGIRLMFASGNIVSGRAALYRLRKR